MSIYVCCFQYDGQGDKYSQALDYMNMIFTGVFTVEFVLKLAAFRFKVGSDTVMNSQSSILRFIIFLSLRKAV